MIADLSAFRYLLKGRFWIDLWNEINYDDCWGMAAQLSYYFLLAFIPFLIFLLAFVGFIPIHPDLQQKMLSALDQVLPDAAYSLISGIILSLINNTNSGALSLGLLLTLWSASRAFAGMVGVLNRAYEVRDRRSFFKIQLLAVGVTMIFSVFVIVSTFLLFFGDALVRLILSRGAFAQSSILQQWGQAAYWLARWLVIFTLLNVGIQLVYYLLPARRLPWRIFTPGGLVATLGWIAASQGFAWYTNSVADYQKIYGSLGALIVLMVWFYLSSLLLLTGGEIDSEIYRLRKEMGRAKVRPQDRDIDG
ncbi:MAG: YihY/virulence factor BrkB family protein [Acidobacteria bacterium]|nr:MAG: YihY/virulence factor BrkB family protein [Acidobacteriota bacterium]